MNNQCRKTIRVFFLEPESAIRENTGKAGEA